MRIDNRPPSSYTDKWWYMVVVMEGIDQLQHDRHIQTYDTYNTHFRSSKSMGCPGPAGLWTVILEPGVLSTRARGYRESWRSGGHETDRRVVGVVM